MKYISLNDIHLPNRHLLSHKGENGKVLIAGGSEDYVGALVFAGIAALRTGADIVTVVSPEKVSWAINCLSPDIITKKCKGKFLTQKSENIFLKLAANSDVALIGNGIGLNKKTEIFINNIIKKIKIPIVLDADGIKLVRATKLTNSVITPHISELEIFIKNNFNNLPTKNEILKAIDYLKKERDKITKENEKNIKEYLEKYEHFCIMIKDYLIDFLEDNNIIIIKGYLDCVITNKKVIFNKTGNPGMSVSGTGDILAGILSGFIAQGLNNFDAACNAVFINGFLGDYLLDHYGFGFIASDFLDNLPIIIKKLENSVYRINK